MVIDNLTRKYPIVKFIEFDPAQDLDLVGDIDYLGYVDSKAFGIQIKPFTAQSNFGNYSATERMKASFCDFEAKYGGKVFVVFSVDDEIKNTEVLDAIEKEIARLKKK